jgi:protein-tyrosine phosphatase
MKSWDSLKRISVAKAMVEDRSVPSSFSGFSHLVHSLSEYLRTGKAVAVHCRAGIGRSSMIVAAALIQNGFSVETAFRAIEEARGCPVPDTPEQRQWMERHLPEKQVT